MKTVLMIDDNQGILDAFSLVFESAGYAVKAYNNPMQVLQNNFEEPDIFIIDKQLNGADGGDVCKYLKKRKLKKNTPVVLFSAGTRIQAYAREAGADAYLEKPFQTIDLLALIHRLTSKLSVVNKPPIYNPCT